MLQVLKFAFDNYQYDEAILLNPYSERGRGKRRDAGPSCPFLAVCVFVLFMSGKYSTDTDTETQCNSSFLKKDEKPLIIHEINCIHFYSGPAAFDF